MNQLNYTKLVSITPPAAINSSDNTAFTTAEIDTRGWDYLQVIVQLGATDAAIGSLAVTESDTSGSNHTNVTGLVWGTSTNIAGSTSTLPSSTNDNGFFVFEIDLRGRKRYIDLTVTTSDVTTGTFLYACGLLSRSKDAPTTAAERGCVEILRV